MRSGQLEAGEQIVSAEELAGWELSVPIDWTVTIRPDRIDSITTPLGFGLGAYTAHDYYAWLQKRLVFVVVTAEVYSPRGTSMASDEIMGVEWRPEHRIPRVVRPGEANVDELLSGKERELLVTNAVLQSRQQGESR
ncbi:hypothetical protein [Amycolatopsis sp. CA-230715]|uniref:hypothetical protein n=1 Tax=Amycolatopsis sp. CA-230715 TaxID=2745196 RepID=UPI001C01A9D8|nr:hypothetical protein [Amycolatopsis sp. CA-230715]QWF78752.1 hypothetical protein HUW46_02150 [Amycolatopsis sp. CA-230715]